MARSVGRCRVNRVTKARTEGFRIPNAIINKRETMNFQAGAISLAVEER